MTTTPCQVGDLAPDARAALDDYLARVRATLDDDLADAVVCDLRTWLLDHLDPSSTADDVRALAEQAGPVDAEPDAADPRLTGTFFGIPYDLSPPTWQKFADRMWDPADPTLLRPHAFGLGWTLNFGAVAVRLGLIAPDAEDESFAHTPRPAVALAAAFPVALAGATVAHYAVRGRSLPDPLPSHWDLAGMPDRWVSRSYAARTDLATTAIAAVVGGVAATSTRGPQRAALLAAASGVAALGATTTVVRAWRPAPRAWLGPAMALGVLGAAGATLFGLAVAGSRAEQRRDLGH